MKLQISELQKRWQTRAVLAVSLHSGSIDVSVLRRDASGTHVTKSFSLPIGADAVLADPESAGNELAAMLEKGGIRERRCVVCVPPNWALTTTTDLPEVSPEDFSGYLELRAEREFSISISDFRLSHCVYRLPDGKSRATIAAVSLKRVEAVERMLATAECRAVSISLGLDRWIAAEEPTTAHFVANGTHVDLLVTSGGGIAALRSLPGSAAMTSEQFDATGFCREVRITLGRLPGGVREQIREARFDGAAASAEKLCSEIRGPLQKMGMQSRLCASGTSTDTGVGSLATARRYLSDQPVAFEFVPPQQNRWQVLVQRFDSRKRRWVVLAAVGLIVIPILIFLIRSHIESSLEQEWNGMRSSVAELEALQLKIRQYRPWFESSPQGLRVLESLVGSFPDTGEVWAKGIQLTEGNKVVCTGFARNQGSLMSFLDRLRALPDVAGLQLQQQRGENPIQFSVTYKWEPKHAQ